MGETKILTTKNHPPQNPKLVEKGAVGEGYSCSLNGRIAHLIISVHLMMMMFSPPFSAEMSVYSGSLLLFLGWIFVFYFVP